MGYPKSRIVNFMENPFIHGWELGVPPFQEPWFDGKTSDGAIIGPVWYLFMLTMRMDMRNVSTFRSFGQCTRQANQSCVRHCKTLIFMCFCAGSCRTFGARFFSLLVTATIHEQRFQHSIKCKCTLLPHPSTPTAPTKQPCVHVFHILDSSIFYDSVS